MMNKLLLLLITMLLLTISTTMFGQQLDTPPQEESVTALDKMLVVYEQKKAENASGLSPESERRRLQSEIIDLKVEKDQLTSRVEYLKAELTKQQRPVSNAGVCSKETTCIPAKEVEREKITSHLVYSLSLYRLAELTDTNLPIGKKYVEAHTAAQRVMQSAMGDLNLLGFDTSDPNEFPSLEELIKAMEISHEAHR
jgi:hypothetical protein